MKDQLDGWAKRYPDRFSVHYIVDKPSLEWKGDRGIFRALGCVIWRLQVLGYITQELIEKYMPRASDSGMYFFCLLGGDLLILE